MHVNAYHILNTQKCQLLILITLLGSIKVTKLENEKGKVVIFSKCPSLTYNVPKTQVSGIHPVSGV